MHTPMRHTITWNGRITRGYIANTRVILAENFISIREKVVISPTKYLHQPYHMLPICLPMFGGHQKGCVVELSCVVYLRKGLIGFFIGKIIAFGHSCVKNRRHAISGVCRLILSSNQVLIYLTYICTYDLPMLLPISWPTMSFISTNSSIFLRNVKKHAIFGVISWYVFWSVAFRPIPRPWAYSIHCVVQNMIWRA